MANFGQRTRPGIAVSALMPTGDEPVLMIDYMVVGSGGGGGGTGGGGVTGGGGGGGVSVVTDFLPTLGDTYTITIGNAGAHGDWYGNNGGTGSSCTFDSITTSGGGGHGSGSLNGGAGGTGGTGTTQNGTNGGSNSVSSVGYTSDYSGSSVVYGQGGYGGNSGYSSSHGIAGTGSGGNGGNHPPSNYGNYGSVGSVIIRYPDTFGDAAAVTGSPTFTTSGGYKRYNFAASGTIRF